MKMNIELAEYRSLYATLKDLNKKLHKRKLETLQLLQMTATHRKNAILVLTKANRLVRHLTGRQRQLTGITSSFRNLPTVEEHHTLLETRLPEFKADCRSLSELKQQGLLLIALIDDTKKKLLQLDLLELRCRELILSIDKALDAFRHELRIIRRKLYPFGVFSFLFRYSRHVFGKTFFTSRDLEDIAALGKLSGLTLKIANSPLL